MISILLVSVTWINLRDIAVERVIDWVLRLDGLPVISVIAPLTGSNDDVVAYLEGVFAISVSAVTAARMETLKTVAGVIAIVMATAIVLYPVIIHLVGRLARTSRSLLDSHMETLNVLGSDTDAHNYRVTIMAVKLAEAFGLTAREMRSLIKGAFLRGDPGHSGKGQGNPLRRRVAGPVRKYCPGFL